MHDEGNTFVYNETFAGPGLVVLSLAWIVMGLGWLTVGALLNPTLAARQRGRSLLAWQNRLLIAGAVAVLTSGFVLVLPALLGVRGTQ